VLILPVARIAFNIVTRHCDIPWFVTEMKFLGIRRRYVNDVRIRSLAYSGARATGSESI
jgi:hypothetical protein